MLHRKSSRVPWQLYQNAYAVVVAVAVFERLLPQANRHTLMRA
jgi:hypothetical protein